MPKSTSFKRVTVKEDPKTSLRAAKIHPMQLKDGAKIVALGHLYFPYHDRSLFELILKYLRDEKPDVVLLQGGIISEEAFKSLSIGLNMDSEDNYLHDEPEVPEVVAAQDGLFEDRVNKLAESCREGLFQRIAEASGGLVVWTPSWTHLSMPNEVRMMEWIQATKRNLDNWMNNHPDSEDVLSNPKVQLPKRIDQLFGLENIPNIKVLRYGAGVMVNKDLLFVVGDFRRRQPGDSSNVEWEQRGISVVRSFDGKVASWWKTTPDHTLPGLRLKYWQGHEIGYLWDPIHMAHTRDYDRRSPGFWQGRIVFGKVVGYVIPVLRGKDGRRSFVYNSRAYTEEVPSCTWDGEEISLPHPDAILGRPEAMSSRPVKTVRAARKTTAKKGRSKSK